MLRLMLGHLLVAGALSVASSGRAAAQPAARSETPASAAAPAVLAVLAVPALPAATTVPAAAPATPTAAASAPDDTSTDLHLVRWSLDIDAPAALLGLLEKHLDLARFERLAQTEPITRSELTRLLAAAPAQVSSLLETEGYFSAVTRTELTPPVASEGGGTQAVHVRLRIDAGPRTLVAQVQLDIDGALKAAADGSDAAARTLVERLQGDWQLPAGEAFVQADWSSAKAHVLALLRAEGYATPSWSRTAAQVDVASHTVALVLALSSGPLYRYGAVTFVGLNHVAEDAVRPLLTFSAGEPLREQPLIDVQERLVRTGLFDTVAVTVDPDPDQAAATPIVVRLGERAQQQATLGVGISDSTGPRVTLEHLHQAVFGLGWQAKSKLQVGRLAQSLSLDLTSHPRPGPYRDLVGAALGFTEASGLGVTNQKLRVGRTQDTERIERLYYVEWQRAVTRPLDGGPKTDDVSSVAFNYQWIWRDLDHPILPTRGVGASAEAGVGQSFHTAADSGLFSRATGRVTGYWPFGDDWYSQARLQLGQVFPTGVSVPYTLLFRAGGDDSVRGYGYQTLGPADASGTAIGGRVLATSSVELARPLAPDLPSLWGAAFVDAGGAALSWRDYHASLGYGVGLRWRSPVGPLRIDLAYGRDVRRMRLHFTVGITF